MGIVLPIWHCYASVNWEEEIESELTDLSDGIRHFFGWTTIGAPMYPKVYLMKFRDFFGDWGVGNDVRRRTLPIVHGKRNAIFRITFPSIPPPHPTRPLFSHFGKKGGGEMSLGKKL